MSESDVVAVEYQLAEGELVAFFAEGMARSRLYRWLWPHRRFAIGLIFIAITMAVSLALGSDWWADWHARFAAAVAFGAFVFLLSCLDPLITGLLLRPRLRSGKYAQFLRPIRIEVSPMRVLATDKLSGDAAEWSMVRHVGVSKIGIVLYLAPTSALMVPRRAFDDDAAFVYFLKAVNSLPRFKG